MSAAILPIRPAEREDAVAILVHGTFADNIESRGSKWWQVGSPFAEKLRRALPPGVRLATEEETFHWSGDNSERSRNKAAGRLLDHLEEQEQRGRTYHLVGHSHGGSVIWNALKLATHRKTKLPGLKSWTTVGTPFLQHRSRGALSPSNVLAVLLTIVLLRPAWLYGSLLYTKVRLAIVGGTPELALPPENKIGLHAIVREPLINLLELLGVPFERGFDSVRYGADSIRFGSYHKMMDSTSFAEYLFASPEGLVLLGVTALAAYLYLMLALVCFVPAIESHRIRSEYRLEKRAYARFGPRWLGIWSRDDEAINGLRATLDLSVNFVGPMMPRDLVFVSDTPSLLYRPILWFVGPVYNHVIRPVIDGYVRGIVIRSAQGNDRPTATLVDVTPTPVACSHGDFRALPSQFNEQLLGYSDARARNIAPKLRKLLGQPSFSIGLEAFAAELSGQELIHTAYFDHEEIAALISRNMSFGCGGFAANDGPRLPLTLLTWFAHSKEESFRHCAAKPAWARDEADPPTINDSVETRRIAA